MNPRLRAKIYAEWRGYEEPKQKPDRCKVVGPVVLALAKELGLGDQMDEEELKRIWKDLVGEFLALHSTPVRLREGVLTVQVLQPTIHYELDRNWKPKVLKRLKEHFGPKKIREIRFRC